MAERLIIVSNRLPVVLEREADAWRLTSSSGGLVAALAPVLRNRGGVWIGWSGITTEDMEGQRETTQALLAQESERTGYDLRTVDASLEDIQLYYQGFSNEIIWPLFHDLQSRCNFEPGYWQRYQIVNRNFAHAVRTALRQGDYVWVHDYQLLLAGHHLRELGVGTSIGFFLHIPFPPLDIFLKLPWRFDVLKAMLEYDLIGFQTLRDRRNFVSCVRTLLPEVQVQSQGPLVVCTTSTRTMRLAAIPISIDHAALAEAAARDDVADEAWYLHEKYPDTVMLLGIDRLDYTKGIPFRLRSFQEMLRRHEDMIGHVALVQVVVPSRVDIPEYHELKTQIEQLVGKINGEFSRDGWVPIHYQYRSLSMRELLGCYRACEVACVTPLKDGMNLIAKEYCTAKVLNDGVLILSEFAGAAAQMHRHALLVNPYDIESVADAMYRAVTMPMAEQRSRMRRLRTGIRRQDVFWWLDVFLDVAFGKDLVDFPIIDEYIPAARTLSADVSSDTGADLPPSEP
jgi:trehalose 6-phosphate synthase/phosphatase